MVTRTLEGGRDTFCGVCGWRRKCFWILERLLYLKGRLDQSRVSRVSMSKVCFQRKDSPMNKRS